MKLIIHLLILGGLIGLTWFAWQSTEADLVALQKIADERALSGDPDLLSDLAAEGNASTDRMIKVGAPLMAAILYAGILTVIYILPRFVDHVSEELMGSSETIKDDPRIDARAAIANDDIPEAIRIYRGMWQEDQSDYFPLVEIAKLQRKDLESPALAADTLEEALAAREWSSDEASFLRFRLADIYEEDLGQLDKVKVHLKGLIEKHPEARQVGLARRRLEELGAS